MPRRGTNIYKRKDGRWEGRVMYEHPVKHQKKYHSVYGKTYQETRQKMELEKERIRKGNSYTDIKIDELAKLWLSERRPYLKPSTAATYQNMVEAHILPRAGSYKVSRFHQAEMDQFAMEIRFPEGKQPLSLSYSRSICSLLLTILSYGRKKYSYQINLPENPISTEKKKQLQLPSESSLNKLEDYLILHAKEDTYYIYVGHAGIRYSGN